MSSPKYLYFKMTMTSKEMDAILDEYRAKYPRLITLEEVAAITRRTMSTIYRWSARGVLDPAIVKRGRVTLLDRDRFVQLIYDENSPL